MLIISVAPPPVTEEPVQNNSQIKDTFPKGNNRLKIALGQAVNLSAGKAGAIGNLTDTRLLHTDRLQEKQTVVSATAPKLGVIILDKKIYWLTQTIISILYLAFLTFSYLDWSKYNLIVFPTHFQGESGIDFLSKCRTRDTR